MMKKVLLFYLLATSLFLFSQESNTLNFSLLRQNDVISINEKNNFYEKFKQIKLSENSTLSFGGSNRTQVEAFINEQFNKDDDEQTDIWFLNRTMIHAHLKINTSFEFFAELNSSLVTSKENLVPVDKDQLSFNQLFATYKLNKNWKLLVGRQNMRLGSGRLVDVREGPNIRLSFDMAQIQYKNSKTNILAFHAVPVQQQEGIFDNNALRTNETLSGVYWTQNWKNTNTDFYVFYKKEDDKTWNLGTANDNRTSVGIRHFGSWKGLDYNNEFVYQFGKFGTNSISAWTASFNIEKPFEFGTIGFKTEAISGDNNNSESLNTFDGLYPRGAYFGRVARIGPSNLIDIHPYLETEIGKLNLQLDYVAFWRYSNDDGVYNAPLILEYPDINESSFIGHQIGGILAYEINEHLAFELESNIIFPGEFLKESNLGDTLTHFVFTTEIKF